MGKQELVDRFMVREWEQIRKGGGVTFSVEQVQGILEMESNKVLSREELITKVLNYFSDCIEVVEDADTGKKVSTWKRNPTKSGLALCLGVDKQTLLDMVKGLNSSGKPYSITSPDIKRVVAVEDFDILRKAYAIIETFYEEKLADNRNVAGVIYWLNNAVNTKWSNEQEFKFATMDHNIRPVLTAADLPQLGGANKGCVTKQPLPILKTNEETMENSKNI